MAWNECDVCKGTEYSESDPFVEHRQRRPSDHSDMCCTMAGHAKCFGVTDAATLPSIGEGGGIATNKQWNDWIESPAAYKAGYLFLT